jgi:hypothetical protein
VVLVGALISSASTLVNAADTNDLVEVVCIRSTAHREGNSVSMADGMCVERIAIRFSSLPNRAYTATQLAEKRTMEAAWNEVLE